MEGQRKQAYSVDDDSTVLLQSPLDHENEHGLWISWDGRKATFRFLEDHNLQELHPNIFVPKAIRNTKLLKGGGSGATVFAGELFSEHLVWKHGDHKDVGEVFGLAKIEHQLLSRSETAAQELRSRIPTFKGIYISPHHIRVRSQELWTVVQKAITKWSRHPSEDSLQNSVRNGGQDNEIQAVPCVRRSSICSGKTTSVKVLKRSFRLSLSHHEISEHGVVCDYDALADLVDDLKRLQQKHFWKVSIAQSTVGGPYPRTASALHLSGELTGSRLNSLIGQFIRVLRALQELATDEERDAAKFVRDELDDMDENATAANVSSLSNAFVGFAVHKNFHPENGRLRLIRETGLALRDGSLILTPPEELPGKVLGEHFLDCRAQLSDLFGCQRPDQNTPLYSLKEAWFKLLRDASSLETPAATRRVWTCGLTDAGIHNMFFSSERLWLFDLDEPGLQPIPAFLTKFLMSFFHTLGMEETTDGTSWVNRFEPSSDNRLVQMTETSEALLAMAHETFDSVLNRIVRELFEGDEAVRRLLIKYVALQLVSDCAFCLERWQRKGGGSPSYDNHQTGLEKWLWRAIWDLFVCSEVSRIYK